MEGRCGWWYGGEGVGVVWRGGRGWLYGGEGVGGCMEGRVWVL